MPIANLAAIVTRARLPFWDPFGEYAELFVHQSHWSAWDVVILGGQPLPGVGSVKGSAVQRVEVQKVNGRDGGALIERGYTPGQLDIDLLVWLPEQWVELQRLMPIIYPRSAKLDVKAASAKKKQSAAAQAIEIEAAERRSLSIEHPGAAYLQIKTVIVEQVALPVDGPVPLSKIFTFKCIEYVPPTTRPHLAVVKGKVVIDPGKVETRFKNKGAKPSVYDANPVEIVTPEQGVE